LRHQDAQKGIYPLAVVPAAAAEADDEKFLGSIAFWLGAVWGSRMGWNHRFTYTRAPQRFYAENEAGVFRLERCNGGQQKALQGRHPEGLNRRAQWFRPSGGVAVGRFHKQRPRLSNRGRFHVASDAAVAYSIAVRVRSSRRGNQLVVVASSARRRWRLLAWAPSIAARAAASICVDWCRHREYEQHSGSHSQHFLLHTHSSLLFWLYGQPKS